ncbi:uncharacterized protein LOC124369787 [Homalodisca vitripennis]|uniref:uncharacterized protein LOC124369787 n=1 Tax=Homalodisca vitripennis TaxID=197043 RepID=UPI001EEB1D3E|nr:uncharacterized protein LOC124369787 [Homalodisca vitripennis]XP_046683841.1 uncharacterized protein LOC124369787 [Homalodisca vitripennis]
MYDSSLKLCVLACASLLFAWTKAQDTTDVPITTLPTNERVCKDPTVLKRRIDGDVRAASPFYVVAMTKTPETEQIDNICYTYFENNNVFLHIISTVYTNGSSSQVVLYKHDIDGRPGVAAATGDDCTYHDITLPALCEQTVFPLYRCFLSGACSQLDIRPVPGVDVRLLVAANPNLSDSCLTEIKSAMNQTTALDGNDFTVLQQKQDYQCITSYEMKSINFNQALGSKSLLQL